MTDKGKPCSCQYIIQVTYGSHVVVTHGGGGGGVTSGSPLKLHGAKIVKVEVGH